MLYESLDTPTGPRVLRASQLRREVSPGRTAVLLSWWETPWHAIHLGPDLIGHVCRVRARFASLPIDRPQTQAEAHRRHPTLTDAARALAARYVTLGTVAAHDQADRKESRS